MTQRKVASQTILKYLESQNRQLQMLTRKVDDMQAQLKTIKPQTYLHPIPKPRQGKEFSRSTSVAGWLFDSIEALNESIPRGQQKYMQFPGDIDSRRLNSDCIRELEGLMAFHIPDFCGKFTWEEACSRSPRDCEKIIREAKALPELAVFSQAAGQWALRMLCANKMRTMIAQTKKKSGKAKAVGRALANIAVSNGVDESQEVEGAMAEMLDEAINGSSEHGRTVDDDIQSLGEPEMGEGQVSDQEEENDSPVHEHEDSLSNSNEREYCGVEERDPTQSGEELLSDFPQLQEEDLHPVHEEQSVQFQRSEMEHDVLSTGSNEIGSSQKADPLPQTENNDSPAHMQAAAQKAATQMLASTPRSASLHKSVFPDHNQVPRAVGKPKSPARNKTALLGIKKKGLARTERSTGTHYISEGQVRKVLGREVDQNTGRITGSQLVKKPAKSGRTISVPRNSRVPSGKYITAGRSNTQQRNGRVSPVERTTTVSLGTRKVPSIKRADLEIKRAGRSSLTRDKRRSGEARQQQRANTTVKRTFNTVRKTSLKSRKTMKSPSRVSSHAVQDISSDPKPVNSKKPGQKRGS